MSQVYYTVLYRGVRHIIINKKGIHFICWHNLRKWCHQRIFFCNETCNNQFYHEASLTLENLFTTICSNINYLFLQQLLDFSISYLFQQQLLANNTVVNKCAHPLQMLASISQSFKPLIMDMTLCLSGWGVAIGVTGILVTNTLLHLQWGPTY